MSDDRDDWIESVTPFRLLAAIVGLWLLSPIVMRLVLGKLATAGLAGDSYGALNALFSGLAFGGVIYAILLQRRELQLQRAELTLTRAELERSAAAQEKSEAALGEQAGVMKVSAELNALSALIQAQSMQLDVLYNEGATGSRPRAHLIAPLEDTRTANIDSLEEMLHAIRSASE